MGRIRILHLSDFHFTEKQDWDRQPILKRLIRAVRGLESIDLIAITGDIAFSGKAEEYELATDFLQELLKTTGLSPERLLMVPGNHDVDRSKRSFTARSLEKAILAEKSQDILAEVLGGEDGEALLSRHAAYLNFANRLTGRVVERPYWYRQFNLKDFRLGVAGLCSSLMSGSDQDRGRLLLGRYQLSKTIEPIADADLRISLLHHPADYLADWDRSSWDTLCHKSHLILRGHQHGERFLQVDDAGNKTLVMAAGSVHSRGSNQSFQLLDIDSASWQITVRVFRYERHRWFSDRNIFADDTEALGRFSLPGKPAASMPEKRAPVTISVVPERATIIFQNEEGYQFKYAEATLPHGANFEIFSWFHEYVSGKADDSTTYKLRPVSPTKYDRTTKAEEPGQLANTIRQMLLEEEIDIIHVLEHAETLRHIAPSWTDTWLIHGIIDLVRGNAHASLLILGIGESLEPSHSGLVFYQAIAHALCESPATAEALLRRIASEPELAGDYHQRFPERGTPLVAPLDGDPAVGDVLEALDWMRGTIPNDLTPPISQPQAESQLPICLRGFTIEGFRGFEKAHHLFPKITPWVFLTGENAEGKSSLLQALAVAIFDYDDDVNEVAPPRIDVWLERNGNPQWFSVDGQHIHRMGGQNGAIIGYGPKRLELSAQTSESEQRRLMKEPMRGLMDQSGFLINVEQYLKDLALSVASNNDSALQYRLNRILEILADLMPSISKVRISGHEVIYEDGSRVLRYNQLSAGNRAVLGLVGDILVRLFDHQPKAKNTEDLIGLVFIDELEAHLHPNAQYALPQQLAHYFPKVQFIVSTHSPIPLLGAPTEVTVLRVMRDETGTSSIQPMTDIDLASLTPNTALTSPIFGLTHLFSKTMEDVSQVHPEDFFEEIEKTRQRDDFLTDEAGTDVLPNDFLEGEAD